MFKPSHPVYSCSFLLNEHAQIFERLVAFYEDAMAKCHNDKVSAAYYLKHAAILTDAEVDACLQGKETFSSRNTIQRFHWETLHQGSILFELWPV